MTSQAVQQLSSEPDTARITAPQPLLAASAAAAANAPMAKYPVSVRAIVWEAEGIASFELRNPDGGPLPPFTAGSHIDVHIPPDFVRQYSLCNDPAERHRYVIAALREEKGRGGSRALHDGTRVGDTLTIGGPRNHFALSSTAERHLLVAGGIGVTPMMAMLAQLEATGAAYKLYYCTRSLDKTAFADRLDPLVGAGKVVLHHDGGDASRSLDLARLLETYHPGTHLYYCGPAGFMEAARRASAHWPSDAVHCEYFTPPAEATPPATANRPFKVKLARSGLTLDVPADRTIVDVLRANDVFIETSCENGICGTCLTRYVDGEPEHRDVVLDASDRNEFVLVCCARSKTPVLTLDL
jgi:ferredoxin-NADP reductase